MTSGAGSVKWQQVSEDLVPVNITCIQDTPETIFHITAYNCQVDKILDVRLVQPGNYTLTSQRYILYIINTVFLLPYFLILIATSYSQLFCVLSHSLFFQKRLSFFIYVLFALCCYKVYPKVYFCFFIQIVTTSPLFVAYLLETI